MDTGSNNPLLNQQDSPLCSTEWVEETGQTAAISSNKLYQLRIFVSGIEDEKILKIQRFSSQHLNSAQEIEQSSNLEEEWTIPCNETSTPGNEKIFGRALSFFNRSGEKIGEAGSTHELINLANKIWRGNSVASQEIDPARVRMDESPTSAKMTEVVDTLFTPPPPSKEHKLINDKMLGHILGDSFLGGTELEGGTIQDFANYLSGFFENSPLGEEFSKLKSEAFDWEIFMRFIRNNLTHHNMILPQLQSEIDSFLGEYVDRIRGLKDGEKLILPGGWSGIPRGHQMIYIVERQGEDNYSFSCLNSGGGVEHHDLRIINDKIKYSPIYTLENISLEAISDINIYRNLYGLLNPYKNAKEYANHSQDDIYSRILHAFGGKEKSYADYPDEHYITPQRSGTCGWGALQALLKQLLPDQRQYKQGALSIKNQALIDWKENHPVAEPHQKRLLQLSCEVLAKYAVDNFNNGLITEKQLKLTLQTITETFATYGISAPEIASSSSVLTTDASKSAPPKFRVDEIAFPQLTISKKIAENSTATKTEPISLKINDFQDLNKENFVEKLTHLTDQLEKALKGNQGSAIEYVIASALADLVLKTRSPDFWKDLDAQTIQEASKALDRLGDIHFRALLQVPIDQRGTYDQIAMTMCITYLVRKLALEDPRIREVVTHSLALFSDDQPAMNPTAYQWISNPLLREAVEISNQELSSGKYQNTFDYCVSQSMISINIVKPNPFYSASPFPEFVNNRAFQEIMETRHPEWSHLAKTEKLRKLVTDVDGTYLPQSLCNLHKAYMRLKYQKNCPTLVELKTDHVPRIKITADSLEGSDEQKFTFRLGDQLIYTSSKVDPPKGIIFETKGFDSIVTPYKKGDHVERSLDNQWTSEANIAVTLGAVGDIPQEEMRLLVYAGSHQTVAIPQLLAYFESNPDKLSQHDHQWLLLKHLLHGDNLRKICCESPVMSAIWEDFLNRQLNIAQASSDIKRTLYLLYLKRIAPPPDKDLIKNAQEIVERLHSLQGTLNLTKEDDKRLRGVIAGHLVAALSQLPQEKEVQCELAGMGLIYQTFADKTTLFPFQKKEIENVLSVFLLPILRDLPLQEITDSIGREFAEIKNRNWNQVSDFIFRNETTEGKTIEIDLYNQRVIIDRDIIGGMPKEICEYVDFAKLIADQPYSTAIKSFSPKVYVCRMNDAEGREIRSFEIEEGKSGDLIIRTTFEGKEYELIPFQKIEEIMTSHQGLTSNLFYWKAQDRPSIELRRPDGSLYAVARLQTSGKYTVERFNPGQSDHEMLLQDVHSLETSKFQALKSMLDRKDHMLVWGNKKIEIPLLKTSFSLSGSTISWDKDPSYQISPQQSELRSLPGFTRYLMLENSSGQKKVLIPRTGIKNVDTAKAALASKFDLKAQSKPAECYAFSLKADGTLSGSTVEENLFLAFIHVAQKDYLAAYQYLSQTKINPLHGYNECQYQIIEQMLGYMTLINNQHPHALVCQIQLLNQAIRNGSSNRTNAAQRLEEAQNSLLEIIRKYPNLKILTSLFPLNPEMLLGIQLFRSTSRKSPLKVPQLNERLNFNIKENMNKSSITESNLDLGKLINPKDLADRYFLYLDKVCHCQETEKGALRRLLMLVQIDPLEDNQYDQLRLHLIFILDQDQTFKDKIVQIAKSQPHSMEILNEIANEVHRECCKAKSSLPKESQPLQRTIGSLFENTSSKQPQIKKSQPSQVDLSPSRNAPELPSLEAQIKQKGVVISSQQGPLIEPDPELLNCFKDDPSLSPVVRREFSRMREEIRQDCKQRSNQEIYFLESERKKTIEEIQLQINEKKSKAEKLKEEILALANREPNQTTPKTLHKLSLIGKKNKILTIDDIIMMCLQQNGAGLLNQNPHLTQEDADMLARLTSEYLIEANQQRRLESARTLLKAADKASNAEDAAQLTHDALEEVKNDSLLRADEFVLHVFSYYGELSLRPLQIETLRKMKIDPSDEVKSQVLQLIMGSGKSKVLLPLLAFLNSTGRNIPILMVPDSLFETNSPDLRYASGEFVNQEVETCYFSQNHQLTENDLLELKGKLARIKQNKSYLLTTPWSMHLLQLNHKWSRDALFTQIPPPEEARRMYELTTDILKILKEQGDLLCDEFDTIMNVSLEANRPIGHESGIPIEVQELVADFFQEIVNDPKFAILKLSSHDETQISKEVYEKELKPQLADVLMGLLKKQGIPAAENWRDYLCGNSFDCPVNELTAEQKRLVGHALGMLNTLLFPALIENPLQHYGPSKTSSTPFVIPYDSDTREPKEGSEFNFYFETMVRTYLYYSKEKVAKNPIETIIADYRSLAQVQAQAGNIPFNRTAAYREFMNNPLFEGHQLDRLTDVSIRLILKRINSDPLLRVHYAKEYAIRHIQYYKEKTSSNPYTLTNMFRSASGFSATLANQDTFDPKIKTPNATGVDGTSLNIMWEKSKVLFAESNETSLFAELSKGGYRALVDAGAWFRGVSNSQVARRMAKHYFAQKFGPKGIVYINDVDIPEGTKGTFVIFERQSENQIPKKIIDSNIPPEDRFTYYHIGTGLDLVQGDTAEALVTESRKMSSREAFQGMGRMRKLKRKQKAHFLTTPEMLGKDPSIGGLIRKHAIQQAETQEVQNLRSTFMLIDTIVSLRLENLLNTCPLNDQQKIYQALRPFLVEKNEDDVWQLFAEASGKVDSVVFFKEHIRTKIQKLENAIASYDPNLLFDYDSLRNELTACIQPEKLPQHIPKKNIDVGACQQVSTQQQTQTIVESSSELQIHTQQQDALTNAKNKVTRTKEWFVQETEGCFFTEEFFAFPGNQERIGCNTTTIQEYMGSLQNAIVGVQAPKTFFSQNISMTGNYRTGVGWTELDVQNQITTPFGAGTKPATLCLLIKNKETGKSQLRYLAADEGAYVWRLLEHDRLRTLSDNEWGKSFQAKWDSIFSIEGRTSHVALFSPSLGIIQQGYDPIEPESIKHDPLIVALTTETKFWNGVLDYTDKEVEYLKKWIDRVGPDDFENMLLKNILRYRPNAQAAYQRSILKVLISDKRKSV